MHKNRTILHVDDDQAILRVVGHKLKAMGFDVVSLEDSTQALNYIIENDCRLVMLDIDMPVINGTTLLREIKKHDGGIQVIMLTGCVSMTTVLQSMRWGAEACFFKPVEDYQQLLDAIHFAFLKIDRWWDSLNDLRHRRGRETQAAAPLDRQGVNE